MDYKEALSVGIGGLSFGAFMVAIPHNILLWLIAIPGSLVWLVLFLWLARQFTGDSEL